MNESALVQSQSDVLAELRVPSDRCDVAAPVSRERIPGREQDGPTPQGAAGFQAFQSDETPPSKRSQFRPFAQGATHECLVGCRHLAEPEIIEGSAVIELESCDMTLFDAQGGERLEPVGPNAETCRSSKHVFPKRAAAVGCYVEFEGQFS